MPSPNIVTDEVALTIYIPRSLKKQLGVIAATQETTLKEITIEALIAWPRAHSEKGVAA